MWSMAALSAEAADEAPRASMIAAPRLASVGMNSLSSQDCSTWSATGLPLTSAWNRSGYCDAEWLPQIVILLTSATGTDSFLATWVSARLWSSRIIAVNRSAGTSGAWLCAMSALVLAGLPTTSTRMSSAATSLIAAPWGLKLPPLAASRSARSIHGPRGRAPTSRPMVAPSNALRGSSLMLMPTSSGKAQSSNSIAVPSAALSAGVISSRFRVTGMSGPSMAPEAMRNSSAYPIWPAAPVTVTVTGALLIRGLLLVNVSVSPDSSDRTAPQPWPRPILWAESQLGVVRVREPGQDTGAREISGGSADADSRSSRYRVRARPVAPAAGSATSPAPPSARATAPAFPAPAVMIHTSAARLMVGRVSEIRVGGGLGQLRTATTDRVSYTAGNSGNTDATWPSGPMPSIT